MTRHLAPIALVTLLTPGFAQAQPTQRVDYVVDTITDIDDQVIKLLGGSVWISSTTALGLVTETVIIVARNISYQGKTVPVTVAYVNGDQLIVRHVSGPLAVSRGTLTTVVESIADGAVLRLADGAFVKVPQYDRFDTGFWLPPYPALITSNGLYLYNLKKGKRVWLEP